MPTPTYIRNNRMLKKKSSLGKYSKEGHSDDWCCAECFFFVSNHLLAIQLKKELQLKILKFF